MLSWSWWTSRCWLHHCYQLFSQYSFEIISLCRSFVNFGRNTHCSLCIWTIGILGKVVYQKMLTCSSFRFFEHVLNVFACESLVFFVHLSYRSNAKAYATFSCEILLRNICTLNINVSIRSHAWRSSAVHISASNSNDRPMSCATSCR